MSTTNEACNHSVTRRLLEELWSGGDLAIADELFAQELRHHMAPPGTAPGPAGQRAFLAAMRRRMPGMQTTIKDMFGEGDRVAVRWTRHYLAADGTPIVTHGADILRIADGKIVEIWAYAPQA